MQLVNKRIVITGGTSGIGYEMVKYFHLENEVIVISLNEKKLAKLTKKFDKIIAYQCDLSKLKNTENVANALIKRFKTIDLLVNNAASQSQPAFLEDDFNYHTIAHEVTLNFTSICSLTYLILPALLHQHKATILNINSGLALAPKTSSAIYCATKAALNVFSQSLSYQLEETNISVQQAFLPMVDTSMTKGRGKNKISTQEAVKKIVYGLENNISEHDLGKVKLLRFLLRLAPALAKKIMKNY